MPVLAETSEKAIAKARLAGENADVVEIRVDALEPSEIGRFLRIVRSDKPLLITYRPAEQGGYREISVEQRIEFWNGIDNALDTSGMLFDREGDISGRVTEQGNAVSIRSFHDFEGVPADLDAIYERLAADGEFVKIAVSAKNITDAISVWKLLERAKAENKQLIPIAMGEAGKWTRILGLAHGAFLTYASLDAGSETADGQITAKEMVESYRVKELDENTKVFGIIGDPISQSLSPRMHNAVFATLGINTVFIHLLVTDLDQFMRRMVLPETREVELNFAGFAVTMPHKQAIRKYLDTIDPSAEEIGAVNTVKIEGGKLTGYNTDAYGFITPLKERFGDLKNARVAVFGAGGSARAAVYELKRCGAEVTVFARDVRKAETFANEFGVKYGEISNFRSEISEAGEQSSQIGEQSPQVGEQDSKFDLSDFDIVVDSTSLGMAPENRSLFTADQLSGVKFVYDLVTKSDDTPLIREAKKAGVPSLGGMEMLIAQGAKQFEILNGREAPVDLMRNSLI